MPKTVLQAKYITTVLEIPENILGKILSAFGR